MGFEILARTRSPSNFGAQIESAFSAKHNHVQLVGLSQSDIVQSQSAECLLVLAPRLLEERIRRRMVEFLRLKLAALPQCGEA
jgi:hypothetical protein